MESFLWDLYEFSSNNNGSVDWNEIYEEFPEAPSLDHISDWLDHNPGRLQKSLIVDADGAIVRDDIGMSFFDPDDV